MAEGAMAAQATEDVQSLRADADKDADASDVSARLARALDAARSKLLERSLRNKLVNTNLTSPRARQVRVVDERSDNVFEILRGGKLMAFAPTKLTVDGEANSELLAGPTPSTSELDGLATDQVEARHTDLWLQTSMTSDALQKRLLSLYYESQTIEEEQGVNVLFLALGFLEWREAKSSDIARHAPLLLLPVDLVRDGAKDRFRIRYRQDDLFTNVNLQAWLKEDFGVALPDLPDSDELKPTDYFAAVKRAIGTRDGWAVHDNEIVAGFFSFAKYLLWRDLAAANWLKPETLLSHPLLTRILLPDVGAPLQDEPLLGDGERIDEIFRAAELVHVADADSSQAIAIQEAVTGKNLVIQGPPGTGKSQTITNIIAGAVQRGKRVLFIAEKMAALDVVHDKLVKCGLGPICLELHSRKAAKTQVLEQIQQGMNAARPPQWQNMVFSELEDTQRLLRVHSDQLHACDEGRLSLFTLLGRMSLLKAKGAPTPNFLFPGASGWTAAETSEATRRADQFGARLGLAGVPAEHPWRGIGVPTPDRLAQDRLRPEVVGLRAETDALGAVIKSARIIVSPRVMASLEELPRWIAALKCVAERPPVPDSVLLHPALLSITVSLRALVSDGLRLTDLREQLKTQVVATAWHMQWGPVRQLLSARGASVFRIFYNEYRAAIRELRSVLVGEIPRENTQRVQVLDLLIEAQTLIARLTTPNEPLTEVLGELWKGSESEWGLLDTLCRWSEQAQALEPDFAFREEPSLARPQDVSGTATSMQTALDTVTCRFAVVRDAILLEERIAFDGTSATTASYSVFFQVVTRWSEAFERIVQWPPIRDDLAWLVELGCPRLADDVFHGRTQANDVSPVLQLSAYEAMWTEMRERYPDIASSQGDELATTVQRFRHADIDRIRIAADQVAQAHIDAHPTGSAGAVRILREETKKSRKLKPVRKLMDEAGEAIQRFKPVFLMSPLSVAQFIKPGALEFDLLVIDEASQVRPEDALGAIARCKQIVVVGDDRQLPPTNFFNRAVSDDPYDVDDSADDIGMAPVRDVESILNLCAGFPERMLRWHYRSEHPALIATSNRNFYKNRLMLPPSVITKTHDGRTGLMFRPVQQGGYERGATARNEIEAEVVALGVLEHARKSPDLSLGIGTFSVAQRDAIQHQLDLIATQHPEVEEFIKRHAHKERVFVKNLENIQGDERDVIFISVGYGRDRDGRLTQNFGPVGREGGERRLNVLITRARKRCEVFSSLVAEDIKLDGAGKPGVRALCEFLKLAKDGYSDVATPTQRGFDSDFEEAVAYAINTLGYDYHPQVGMAGFFVDIGILDPRNPERYVLGVECDGAAYHSSLYARDRDRLRQTILEKRGWTIHRIWSTDWFYRQQHEIEKLKAAIERAVERSSVIQGTLAQAIALEEPPPGQAFNENAEGSNSQSSASFTPPIKAQQPIEPSALQPARGTPQQSQASGSLAYRFAEILAPERHHLQPPDLSVQRLAELVTEIVHIEQPIHEEEVARRVASAFELQRAGRLIQDAASRGLHLAKKKNLLSNQGLFWSEADAPPVLPRDRSSVPAAAPIRRAALIAPTEYAATIRFALTENLALVQTELITEVARVLGFARTGHDIESAITSALAELTAAGALDKDHMGRIRLRS